MDPIEHPCGACRIKEIAGSCWAKSLANLRLCTLVQSDDGYRDLVLQKSGAESPPPASPPPAPAPPDPGLDELRRKLRLVQECPHWVRGAGLEGCGCQENLCKLGKGRAGGFVKRAHCFACLGID